MTRRVEGLQATPSHEQGSDEELDHEERELDGSAADLKARRAAKSGLERERERNEKVSETQRQKCFSFTDIFPLLPGKWNE